jgi:hypothetical protein
LTIEDLDFSGHPTMAHPDSHPTAGAYKRLQRRGCGFESRQGLSGFPAPVAQWQSAKKHKLPRLVRIRMGRGVRLAFEVEMRDDRAKK